MRTRTGRICVKNVHSAKKKHNVNLLKYTNNDGYSLYVKLTKTADNIYYQEETLVYFQ